MTMGGGARILIADDEKPVRRFLKTSLSAWDYSIVESATGAETLEKAVSSHPDVIILDLGLPDMDGVDVVREIRSRSKIPIIILSVRDDISDKVNALDAGADDYLTKPFSVTELLARIKAVLRRYLPADADGIIRAGAIEVDVPGHRVTVGGREADVTPTEFDVLKLLVASAGKVVTHGRFLQEIWNKPEDLEGVLHLLRVTISNLRSKIEPDPDRPAHIVTEPGIGYRLRADD